MDLKTIQEAYDRCNFTDEQKKVFPRPETEADLEQFNKTIFTPTYGYGSNWSFCLLWLILGMLLLPPFPNGMWGPNKDTELLKEMLKKDEDKKIDE